MMTAFQRLGGIKLLNLISLILLAWLGCQPKELSDQSPNIILIYVDDLGYSDLACYGLEYGNDLMETPNLDRLAGEGMRFTHAYAPAPICSASRAALLSGKSPARLGFEFVTKYPEERYHWEDSAWTARFRDKRLIPPPFTLALPLEEVTLAEALQAANYETGIVGKWHVAPHHQHYLGWSPELGPQQQGFTWAVESFGAHPYAQKIGKQPQRTPNDGQFNPDYVTSQAIEFLGDQASRPQPFFLLASYYYVHTPLDQNLQWLIDKYRAKVGSEQALAVAQYASFVATAD
ncbi:MAG: sulfatase-like hydrolase/transferase, partial [Bacteroidota bacterium]